LDNHNNRGKNLRKPERGRPSTSFQKQVMEDTGIETYWELKRIITQTAF